MAAYRQLAQRVSVAERPVLWHNLALCHLSQGQAAEAVTWARQAYAAAPALWQAGVLLAKALAAVGDRAGALPVLQSLHAQQPDIADVRLELASLTLHVLGQAQVARALALPLVTHPKHGRDAEILVWVTQLYDRQPGVTATAVARGFMDFSQRHLHLPPENVSAVVADKPWPPQQRRLKVGLLSTQFHASPVYFLTIGALQHLARTVELHVFARGQKVDWATRTLAGLARSWSNVAALGAVALAQRLRAAQLDVLIDLGGWMDPVALQAQSVKLAPRMVKWVGGQSLTTGLKTFDGFVTDPWQSPVGAEALHSEPLWRLPGGYVTYTPPPYMPVPHRERIDWRNPQRAIRLGVIANPAKLSEAFLVYLRQSYPVWCEQAGHLLDVVFIDKRFARSEVAQRVQQHLPGVAVQFKAPDDHLAYLQAIAALDLMLDTFPYSGGLTTLEALSLGVPVLGHAGELFAERHTWAHAHYAGIDLEAIDRHSQNPLGLLLWWQEKKATISTQRQQHGRLAHELLLHLLR